MHERPTALELAKVPLTDRGIGWQADATAVLKEQAAEIAALRKDSERYRWLRTAIVEKRELIIAKPCGWDGWASWSGDAPDETIDAAMSASPAVGAA